MSPTAFQVGRLRPICSPSSSFLLFFFLLSSSFSQSSNNCFLFSIPNGVRDEGLELRDRVVVAFGGT
jgi:hypothetical protein